jgi:hypothetical protein
MLYMTYGLSPDFNFFWIAKFLWRNIMGNIT